MIRRLAWLAVVPTALSIVTRLAYALVLQRAMDGGFDAMAGWLEALSWLSFGTGLLSAALLTALTALASGRLRVAWGLAAGVGLLDTALGLVSRVVSLPDGLDPLWIALSLVSTVAVAVAVALRRDAPGIVAAIALVGLHVATLVVGRLLPDATVILWVSRAFGAAVEVAWCAAIVLAASGAASDPRPGALDPTAVAAADAVLRLRTLLVVRVAFGVLATGAARLFLTPDDPDGSMTMFGVLFATGVLLGLGVLGALADLVRRLPYTEPVAPAVGVGFGQLVASAGDLWTTKLVFDLLGALPGATLYDSGLGAAFDAEDLLPYAAMVTQVGGIAAAVALAWTLATVADAVSDAPTASKLRTSAAISGAIGLAAPLVIAVATADALPDDVLLAVIVPAALVALIGGLASITLLFVGMGDLAARIDARARGD